MLKAAARTSSLDQNPARGNTAASASVPMIQVTNVTGIFFRRPPMSTMLLLWTAWITDPEPRNSRALKKPWVKRWKMPAV